jgi:hypothetical protein
MVDQSLVALAKKGTVHLMQLTVSRLGWKKLVGLAISAQAMYTDTLIWYLD